MKTINLFGITLFLVLSACYNSTNTELTQNSAITTDNIELNGNWVIETAPVFPITYLQIVTVY